MIKGNLRWNCAKAVQRPAVEVSAFALAFLWLGLLLPVAAHAQHTMPGQVGHTPGQHGMQHGAPSATPGVAQPAQPYAGQQERAIKALDPDEVSGLLNGQGLGMAKAAELNHYPGPVHVLDFAAELSLDSTQRAATQRIFDAMQAAALELGARIVALERQLDGLFASGEADGERLSQLTAEIGRLRGALRAAHLRAHIEVKQVLKPSQVVRYDALRGY